MSDKYEIRIGFYGQIFHSIEIKQDVPFEEVTDILNTKWIDSFDEVKAIIQKLGE